MLLIIWRTCRRSAHPCTTHILADTGVNFSVYNKSICLMRTDALVIISRTSVNRQISQTAHPSCNNKFAIASWRRSTRAARRNTAAAIRMQTRSSAVKKKPHHASCLYSFYTLEWCGYPMVKIIRTYVYSFWHDPQSLWAVVFFTLAVRITGKLLKIDGYMLRDNL